MSRLTIFLLFTLFIFSSEFIYGQCDPPFTFVTQNDLEVFFNSNTDCDTIHGNLQIGNQYNITTSIHDLSPLKNVKVILGGLKIYNLPELKTLDSLKSLNRIDGEVIIKDCGNLTAIDPIPGVVFNQLLSLSGLPLLTSIPDLEKDAIAYLSLSDVPFENLSFLNNMNEIGHLYINDCDNLLNLNDITNISISRATITNNENLSECAVESICSIVAEDVLDLYFSNNQGICNTTESVAQECFPDSTFCLKVIYTLTNQTELNDLLGLPDICIEAIQSVGIVQVDNSEPIIDLSPFHRFTSLKSLRISNTSELESLVGLENLTSIEILEIINNPGLASTVGFNPQLVSKRVSIVKNDVLGDLPDFLNTGTVEIVLIENQDLLSSAEFQKLSGIADIEINNSTFENGAFLEENKNLVRLSLFNITGIESLDLSTNTSGFSDLSIQHCKEMSSLLNVSFQDTVDQFWISDNVIAELSVSKMANHFNTFYLGEPVLENLQLSSLPVSIDDFGFAKNEVIKRIDFLDSLVSLEHFTIDSNPGLRSIGPTGNLVSNIGELYIFQNPELEVIDALDKDIQAMRVYIRNNEKLSDCAIEVICNKYIESPISSDLVLQNNASGCSIDSIPIFCPKVKNPRISVEIETQEDIDELAYLYPEMDSIFGDLDITRLENLDLSIFKKLNYIEGTLSISGFIDQNIFDPTVFDSCFYSGLKIFSSNLDRLPFYHGADTLNVLELNNVFLSSSSSIFNGLKVVMDKLYISSALNNTLPFNDLEYVSELDLFIFPFNQENFPKITTVESIKLQRQSFTDLDFVYSIDILNSLSLVSCNNINKISFAPEDKKTFERITITSCDLLDSISITSFESLDNITIRFNDLLRHIALDSLKRSKSINFSSNPSLIDISHIPSSVDANILTIVNNSSLEDCNLDLVCNNLNLSNLVSVYGNIGDCDFPASVLASCGVDTDYNCLSSLDLYIKSTSSIHNYVKFYDSCEVIERDFRIDIKDNIQSDTIIFKGLKEIGRDLTILNSNAKCIIFENLTSVGGNISVFDTTLQCLIIKQLNTCQNIRIENCHNLLQVDLDNNNDDNLTGTYWNGSDFNISGNHNLESINLDRVIDFANINISNNPKLKTLDGIIEGNSYKNVICRNNQSIEKGLTFNESVITSSLELSNLNSLPDLFFQGDIFTNRLKISGLSAVDSIHIPIANKGLGTLTIENNTSLKTITGLENDTILSRIDIINNSSLEKLDFLSKNMSTLSLNVHKNENLNVLDLDFGEKPMSIITISENNSLSSISGLDNLYISGSVKIDNNPILKNLDIFHDSNKFRSLYIRWNDSLEFLDFENLNQNGDLGLSIVGLNNLKTIDGVYFDNMRWFYANDNPLLENIEFTNDSLKIETIEITNNPLITDCTNAVICNNIALNNDVNIDSNGLGCENIEEVNLGCFTSTDEVFYTSTIKIFPNPAEGIVHYKSDKKVNQLQLFTMEGRKVPFEQGHESIHISHLTSGEYILKVIYDDSTETIKFIKL